MVLLLPTLELHGELKGLRDFLGRNQIALRSSRASTGSRNMDARSRISVYLQWPLLVSAATGCDKDNRV